MNKGNRPLREFLDTSSHKWQRRQREQHRKLYDYLCALFEGRLLDQNTQQPNAPVLEPDYYGGRTQASTLRGTIPSLNIHELTVNWFRYESNERRNSFEVTWLYDNDSTFCDKQEGPSICVYGASFMLSADTWRNSFPETSPVQQVSLGDTQDTMSETDHERYNQPDEMANDATDRMTNSGRAVDTAFVYAILAQLAHQCNLEEPRAYFDRMAVPKPPSKGEWRDPSDLDKNGFLI